MAKILVVDDMEMMRDSLEATLSRAGHTVHLADGAAQGLELVKRHSLDMIISDLKMPKMDGLAFLTELQNIGSEIPIVMMTAYATIATAVEAIKKGAFDYIQKPFDAEEITLLVQRTLEHRRLLRENEAYRANARDWQRGRRLIGNSPAMQQVLDRVARIAPSSATVLILGESGTGKEMIARAIHAQSPRAHQPLLCVNCAALSSSLLESELFGHEKGAFTGADRLRKGRFELADGGTLLLDEISEMDLALQAKLLRVLQEREFERVGSCLTRQVDVRVIATTNRNLQEMVREGKFREDLFYRLNVVPVFLPRLRERIEDLEPLCEYFLHRCADRNGSEMRILSRSALEVLQEYPWSGNVRELENLMERISILGTAEVITGESIRSVLHLGQIGPAAPAQSGGGIPGDPDDPPVGRADLSSWRADGFASGDDPWSPAALSLEQVERRYIQETLAKYDGHRQKTAQALGIGLRTLGMKIKRWNLEKTSAS
ncbi:MAG: sigma-54-dependent Fis family transcriptional regulator [Sedimentisphaerales bacterium]|nr:sigma-54-dependent Fis family transcriptional regulator [Sedimentisphaerales bacterium]